MVGGKSLLASACISLTWQLCSKGDEIVSQMRRADISLMQVSSGRVVYRNAERGQQMERREFGRRPNAYAGWIKIPGRPRLACRVVGLTQKGALLECEVPAWLPFQFELVVEAEKQTHTCEIRHSRPDRLGVFFVDSAANSTTRRTNNVIEDWMGPKPKN